MIVSLKRLVVTAGLTLGLAFSAPVAAQTAPGAFVAPPVFGSGGLALAVFGGGSVDDLENAARRAGASGVWAQDPTGASNLLVVGGPSFLTEPFRRALSAGFSGPTAVTLTRDASAGPAAPPVSTTPASTPTASPAATPVLPPSSVGPANTGYPQGGERLRRS
jgi:hypothetical protein